MIGRTCGVSLLLMLVSPALLGARPPHTQHAYDWTPFHPVRRPPVLAVQNSTWVRNPIDAFVAAAHERQGLKPRPEAPKHLLLRRVYLDLIGLPPTREELHAFLADPSPDAYEKVVDRLLASPHYGERWGRHWMDVWRYSDWAGYGDQVRDSLPHIWHWRDWIIESLNEDKGYDRMILEMLAADELAPTDRKALRATGYLVRNYKRLSREKWMHDTVEHTAQAFLGITLRCARCHDHKYDPITQKEYYQVRAIFEPHNVRTDRLPGEPDTKKDGLPRAFEADPKAVTYLYVRGDDRHPDKDTPIRPSVPAALRGPELKVESVPLPLTAYTPEKQEFVIQETIAASEQRAEQARKRLQAAREKLTGAERPHVKAERPEGRAQARVVVEPTSEELQLADMSAVAAEAKHAALLETIRVERLEDAGARQQDPQAWHEAATAATAAQRWAALLVGRLDQLAARRAVQRARATNDARAAAAASAKDDKKLEDAAKKAAAELEEARKQLAQANTKLTEAKRRVLLPPNTAYDKRNLNVHPAVSTGRRLAFARWIASTDNPLTARVAVNHIWLRHFGQAIVPSVFDFGQNGQPPSHPALLDWLAAEFIQPTVQPAGTQKTLQPWSLKHIHELIVTSSTYRMASTSDPASAVSDPDNRWLWRWPTRRMEAEVVRDSVLYVAGQLDLTMGGPDLDHQVGMKVKRRSLYFRHAAEKQMQFLKLFDVAAVTECYQRKESITPQQALALANSELTLVQSRLLAHRLAAEAGSDASTFATAAYEQVLSRPPAPKELQTCVQFLAEQTRFFRSQGAQLLGAGAGQGDGIKPSTDPAIHARENLVHVLMNHNDFVTIR